jgi:hypothetical protein
LSHVQNIADLFSLFSHGQWLKRFGDYMVEKSSSGVVGVLSTIQQVWTITNQSSPRLNVALLIARYDDGSISFQYNG